MRHSPFLTPHLLTSSSPHLLKEPVMTLGTVPGLVLGDVSRTSTREPHHLS
ncbi:hypothetical protein [Streptomyces sp. NPDC055189]